MLSMFIKKPLQPIFFGFLMIFSCLGNPSVLWAHERSYSFTEEYRTLPQGGAELEYHTRFKMPNKNRSGRNTWTYMGEAEYGVTDHWTVAHYELWKTENHIGNDSATQYRGFQFETKYRLGEVGKYWLDPLFYLEWKTDPQEDEHPNEIEGKVVLSKTRGKWNLSYNHILESELGEGGRTVQQFSVASGYQILENVHLGAEFKGDYWRPSSNRNRMALGPSLGYAGKYFWITAGMLFGVNEAADDWEARLIVGIPIL